MKPIFANITIFSKCQPIGQIQPIWPNSTNLTLAKYILTKYKPFGKIQPNWPNIHHSALKQPFCCKTIICLNTTNVAQIQPFVQIEPRFPNKSNFGQIQLTWRSSRIFAQIQPFCPNETTKCAQKPVVNTILGGCCRAKAIVMTLIPI